MQYRDYKAFLTMPATFTGNLRIHCRIWMKKNEEDGRNSLALTLNQLLSDGTFSDFTLISDAGTKFPVHKCILAG